MRNRLVKRWLIIALILVLVGTAIYMFLPFFIYEEQYRGTM
jgi:capsular polysaccharide biosynthesis protein